MGERRIHETPEGPVELAMQHALEELLLGLHRRAVTPRGVVILVDLGEGDSPKIAAQGEGGPEESIGIMVSGARAVGRQLFKEPMEITVTVSIPQSAVGRLEDVGG